MEIILLIVAILPVYLLGRYIYKHDFEKEPTPLLVRLFLAGVGSVVVTLILTSVLQGVVPFFGAEQDELSNIIELIPYVFIGVALIEEFAKWVFVYSVGYNNREFNHAYDAVVYAAFVSLGFACIENILYVFLMGDALQTAFIRSISAVPGHACFGILMGYYLALAKTAEKNKNLKLAKSNKIKSIVVPVLAHGIYDYLIFAAAFYEIFFIGFIVFVIFMFTRVPLKVKQLAKIRYDLSDLTVVNTYQPAYNYTFCPICGEPVRGAFCSNCGNRHMKVQ